MDYDTIPNMPLAVVTSTCIIGRRRGIRRGSKGGGTFGQNRNESGTTPEDLDIIQLEI